MTIMINLVEILVLEHMLFILQIDNWTVKGGVSQGYKAPKVNDLHDGINGAGGQGATITIGSPDLKPEKSTNYETGVYYNADNGFCCKCYNFL